MASRVLYPFLEVTFELKFDNGPVVRKNFIEYSRKRNWLFWLKIGEGEM